MNKALITVLSGTNQDNDLPTLGGIRINVLGVENNSDNKITGRLVLKGSKCEWQGDGSPTIGSDYGENAEYSVTFSKTDKGLLLVKNKYNLEKISSAYTYGANVNLEDINKYCKYLVILDLGNSSQTGDLSEIADLNGLKKLVVSYSNVTGNINVLSCLQNLGELDIRKNKSIILDLSSLASCYNLKSLHILNSSATGNLSSLAACTKLQEVHSTGSGIKGSISSLANLESFIYFNDFNLTNTWGSSSLRPSNMQKIMGNIKFASATDTDNFIINMAECAVGEVKTWYFQQSHRTSASDEAVQNLQQQGYTLSQLIKDE